MNFQEYLKAVAKKINIEADEYSLAVDTTLQKASAHLLLGGGKRLRPALVLLSADAVKAGASENLFYAAAGLEWTHTFTLVHDDIMDCDSLRRGRPTVHKVWNQSTAILAGDVLYSNAIEYICRVSSASDTAKVKAIQMLAHTCHELCEGQQEDMDFETRTDVTLPEYMNMIRKKTGVLYAASAGIGAILADGDMKQVAALYTLGLNTGIAFQIQDDIIDLTVPEEISGKNQGSDLRENKQTIIAILAREAGIDLSKYRNESLSKEDIAEAVELLTSAGIIDKAKEISQKLISDAKLGLNVITDSEAKSMILEMVDYFINRSY